MRLRELARRHLYSTSVFVASLCPVAVAITTFVSSFQIAGVRMPPEEVALWALTFLAFSALGHVLVLTVAGPPRAQVFQTRRWALPVGSALVLTAFTLFGLVENSTDVAGRWFGHRFEELLLAVSVLVWSTIATSILVGVDRALIIQRRRAAP